MTTTDANGAYSFPGLLNGLYTITPNKGLFAFEDARTWVTVKRANGADQNFKAKNAVCGSSLMIPRELHAPPIAQSE